MDCKRKRGTLWLWMGGLLIGAAMFLSAYNVYDSKRAEETAQTASAQINEQLQKAAEVPEEAEIPDYVLYPELEMPLMEIDGEFYVGVLEVPVLELSLPVFGNEWSEAKMKKAPCLYEGSVYMKDMIIVGHNYRSHFSKLKTLEPGTEIYFTDTEGNQFAYTMEWVEIIEETDIEAMSAGTEEWNLTLFTCTYGGEERYTLRCVEKPENALK